MIATDTITWLDMVFFEDHLTRCLNAGGMDGWCPTRGLGNLASSAKKIVARRAGNVIGAGEEGAISEVDKVIDR
jgi:hypothetical protein